jgi:outer membrane protein OmpU
MGIVGGDNIETQFHHDLDVKFALSGESDGGIAFGATMDLDEVSNGINAGSGPHSVFVAYGGMRLDMGDTDGAYDAAMQEVALAGGSIADDETSHAGYNGNSGLDGGYKKSHDGQIARVSYSASGFTAGLSVEIDDDGVYDPVIGFGAAYTADMGGTSVTIGAGYQSIDEVANIMGISAKASMAGGFSVGVNFSELDIEGKAENQTHMGIGIGYSMNALSVGLNYGEYNDVDGVDGVDHSGFGLAMTYDLGGGLAAHAGFGSEDKDGVDSDSFSLGLSMSF